MQKKRLFSNPNRKKLIIDNRVYTKNFTGPVALKPCNTNECAIRARSLATKATGEENEEI